MLFRSWFLSHVWANILAERPNIELRVVGKWSDQQKTSLGKTKNLIFTGLVESLQNELKGAISIVPIIRGSGIRMKILDAVNFGTPFISTTIGALGMGFEDGKDCFIADTPQDFTKKLLRLINEENLRKKFYDNSYLVYAQNYHPDVLAKRRFEIYKKVCNIKD